MADAGDAWDGYKEAQQKRRASRLPVFIKEIKCLSINGFEVKRLTRFQYRVGGRIDLYPTHRLFHDISTGERGNYKNALELCKEKIT